MTLGTRILRMLSRHGVLEKDAEDGVSLSDAITRPHAIGRVDYVPADRGVLFDTPRRGATGFANGYSRDVGDVYRVLPTAGVDFGGPRRVTLDLHRFGRMQANDLRSAATVANYYTRLMNDPEFVRRIGGAAKAGRLTSDLSSPAYSSGGDPRANDAGSYNPLTGNIRLNGTRFDAPTAAHELGHRMYYFSRAYRDRISDIMRRHGISYSPVYVPPQLIPNATVDNSAYTYLNQPTEQAAALNAARISSGMMPGTGSGPGGSFTPDDLGRRRSFFDRSPFFHGKPDAYILDLLNEAKARTPASAAASARLAATA